VSFGPGLSPEIFDTNKPSNLPVKWGSHHDAGMVVNSVLGRVATGENIISRLQEVQSRTPTTYHRPGNGARGWAPSPEVTAARMAGM
jgi:hypothetical protein